MTEPVFFGVVRHHGRDEPRLFYDIVPPVLTERGSPLVYCTRLDTLPDGEELARQPLWKLMATYLHLKRAKKLPPEDRGIKPKGGGGETRIGTGERYRFLQATWDRNAPAYPPLSDPAWLAGVGRKKDPPRDALDGSGEGGEARGATPLTEDRLWAVWPPEGR